MYPGPYITPEWVGLNYYPKVASEWTDRVIFKPADVSPRNHTPLLTVPELRMRQIHEFPLIVNKLLKGA